MDMDTIGLLLYMTTYASQHPISYTTQLTTSQLVQHSFDPLELLHLRSDVCHHSQCMCLKVLEEGLGATDLHLAQHYHMLCIHNLLVSLPVCAGHLDSLVQHILSFAFVHLERFKLRQRPTAH